MYPQEYAIPPPPCPRVKNTTHLIGQELLMLASHWSGKITIKYQKQQVNDKSYKSLCYDRIADGTELTDQCWWFLFYACMAQKLAPAEINEQINLPFLPFFATLTQSNACHIRSLSIDIEDVSRF